MNRPAPSPGPAAGVVRGVIHGVGLGPGDPALLTVKAADLIRAARFVAWPVAGGGPSMARRIAAPLFRPDVTELPFAVPVGRPAGADAGDRLYRQAAARLVALARQGHDIVVLCVGDPFFFGSFIHLFHALTALGHTPGVVPGIAAPFAAGARLGLPLARGRDVWQVIPALLPERELYARLGLADAAAIIKLGRHFDKARQVIAALGLTGRAWYLAALGTADEIATPLGSLPPAGMDSPYFSMILIQPRPAGA